MRYRIVFAAGAAVGFVLGARAGRERYEQIMRLVRQAADNPSVQQAAATAQAQAAQFAKGAREQVSERVPKIAESARSRVGEKMPGHTTGSRKAASPSPDGQPLVSSPPDRPQP